MNKQAWLEALKTGPGTRMLAELYGDEAADSVRRIEELLHPFGADDEVFLFSTPGRTELAGNHTDHNHGRVLAAAVQLDILAAVTPRNDALVILESAGFDRTFRVDLSNLEPVAGEQGEFEALIRGVAAGLSRRGFQIGGFQGRIHSRVLTGSGLSSSAAVEVLLGTIFSGLFNAEKAAPELLAKIGQEAENRFFGKPCGLMDQMACALGGITAIDFRDPENPRFESMEYSFEARGYLLAVVDTGGSHANLTPDYAACPGEMFAVARALGKESAREVRREELIASAAELRRTCGDRALLRVFHFLEENRRVSEMAAALKTNNLENYIDLMQASGDSSWKLLQNCYSPQAPGEQGIPLAIETGRTATSGRGAFRVHGGGFAGAIQALLPREELGVFRERMELIFGAGCVTPLRIRTSGTLQLSLE